MAASGGNGGGELLLPLLLFACSAKLWLVVNFEGGKKRVRRRHDEDGEEGPPPHLPPSRPPPLPPSLRRSCNQNNQHPFPLVSNRCASWASLLLKDGDGNNAESSDDSDDDDSVASFAKSNDAGRARRATRGGKKQRKMSGDERMRLMERISLSDAVLTREVSMDFHPKNSNWSHFENYAPSFSPSRKRRTPGRMESVGEDSHNTDDEEFLWSEPPQRKSTAESNDENMDCYTDHLLRSKKYSRQTSSDILHHKTDCLPSKLLMVRHGQSEGNIDESLYATKPDNAMRLTKLGWDMAKMAGKALKDKLPPGETVHFIVSPYARTVETFHGIAAAWCDPGEFKHVPERSKRLKLWYTRLMEMGLTWHEDPRIREQDFGNYQDPQVIRKAKAERHKFGSFYYRFPHGESASDVFDRVSTFLDSLWRSFESGRAQNYVLVAHGISIRVFLARYFRYSIDQFHMLANPKNCEMVALAHDGLGRLKLEGRCELELSEVEDEEPSDAKEGDGNGGRGNDEGVSKQTRTTTTVVTGYKKHSRLRTLPPQWVRPRTVRMCYEDE